MPSLSQQMAPASQSPTTSPESSPQTDTSNAEVASSMGNATYTVKAGDDLADLAERGAGDPLRYQELNLLNGRAPTDTSLEPGTTLTIPSEWDAQALGGETSTAPAERYGLSDWADWIDQMDDWGQDELKELLEKERLTPEEIQRARELIEEKSVVEQPKLYEELQSKVEYLNQRNNDSPLETEGGGTCNITSLAMCFMYLGIPNPDPSKQYEDALAAIAAENDWDITTGSTWEKLGKELGATMTYHDGGTYEKKWFESTMRGWLQGQGVLVGINGHIVRLQAVTDDGLVVDDPYGASKLGKGKNRSWDERNEDKEDGSSKGNVGEDHVWDWSSVTGFDFKWFFTVQAA